MSDRQGDPQSVAPLVAAIERSMADAMQNLSLSLELLNALREAVGPPDVAQTPQDQRDRVIGTGVDPQRSQNECDHPEEARIKIRLRRTGVTTLCGVCGAPMPGDL